VNTLIVFIISMTIKIIAALRGAVCSSKQLLRVKCFHSHAYGRAVKREIPTHIKAKFDDERKNECGNGAIYSMIFFTPLIANYSRSANRHKNGLEKLNDQLHELFCLPKGFLAKNFTYCSNIDSKAMWSNNNPIKEGKETIKYEAV
jgi:hypothetical protein